MYSTPDQPQQWSVHAEFTISHPGIANPQNPPKTETVQDKKGVHMLYSWTADESTSTISPPSQIVTSDSGSSKTGDGRRVYGFQKGNLFFTSTPPTKAPEHLNVPVQDSAYGSDTFSPISYGSSNYHPFNRKCRSTCNIILSNDQKHRKTPENASGHTSCGRTQSLRCQTPSVCCEKKTDGFYGCGDPWCHHLHYNDEFSTVRRISPVREVCEDFTNTAQDPITCGDVCTICDQDYTRSIKRDVSVQTYEMVNKCTSPLLMSGESEKSNHTGKSSKLKRGRTIGYNRSRQSSIRRSTSPISVKRDDSGDLNKLIRSSSFRNTPSKTSDKKESGSEKSGDSSKKPRTIHIDVYCTGTELESDSSSSSETSRSKTVSTPQTVFESKNTYITHKKADSKKLPYRLSKINSTSAEKEDSDNDDSISTAYPSKLSSYSTIGRALSSMSSFPNSTPFSMSSCTVPDYESSLGNTSWKDTFSDIDSLIPSRSSIPQNDSLYFVPQRIEEETSSTRGSQKKSSTSTINSVNLAPSDSFDYADSEDKLRIKRMERMWKNKLLPNYTQTNNKMVLQQQKKLQEDVNKRLSKMNIFKDSDSDASDDSEKGYTILNNRTITESKHNPYIISKPEPGMVAEVKSSHVISNSSAISEELSSKIFPSTQKSDSKEFQASLSDSNSSPCKSPSTLIIKQRLRMDPSLGSPFTIFPGKFTEPRLIAKRFGPVITVFRKPGHHVGPAKNPSCSCDHCRRYFENMGFRNPTCSVGDTPNSSALFMNWKGLKKSSQRQSDC